MVTSARNFSSASVEEEGVAAQPPGPRAPWPDIIVTLSLTEVFLGGKRNMPLPCDRCTADGGARASRIDPACSHCRGTGVDPAGRTVHVVFPPGVASGVRLPVTSTDGPDWSDLHAVIRIADHEPPFRREDVDVHLDLTISAQQAERGGPLEVPTLAGPRRLRVPAAVQSGHVVRMTGFGLPKPDRVSFGDQVVRILVAEPNDQRMPTRQWIEEQLAAPSEVPARNRLSGLLRPAALAAGVLLVLVALVNVALRVREMDPLPVPGFRPSTGFLLAGALLLGSTLLAVGETRLGPMLGTARDRLRGWRSGPVTRARTYALGRFRAFVAARAAPPPRSIVPTLDRLVTVVAGAERREVAALQRVRARLAETVGNMREFSALVKERPAATSVTVEKEPRGGATALGVFAAVLGLTVILAGVNTWMLADIAATTPTPGAGDGAPPGWMTGPLLPLSLSVAAIAAGIVLYGLESLGTTASGPIKAGAYGLILILSLMQGVAYATATAHLDLPGWFGFEEPTFLYFVLRHAPVMVGIAGPLILASLGYSAWLSFDRVSAGRRERSLQRRMDRHTRALNRTHRRLRRVDRAVNGLRARLQVPSGPGTGVRGSGRPSDRAEPGAAVRAVRELAMEVRTTGQASEMRELRSGAQVVAGLVVDTLLLGAWLLAGIVLFSQLSTHLTTSTILGSGAGRLPAACLVLAMGLAGLLARDARWGAAHVSLWDRAVPGANARGAVTALTVAVLGAGAFVTVWAFATGPADGAAGAGTAAMGAFLVLVLVTASFHLDSAVVGAAHLVQGASYGIVWLACGTAWVSVWIAEQVLVVARSAVRLGALPVRFAASLRPAPPG
jgi:hypothetical protein